MIALLKLIRWQNLLIIAALQYLIRWFVVFPLVNANGFELQMSELDFLLMVFSTVFITAAGYVINDYFDRPTDMVNRPDTVVVGTKIKRRVAMILHIVFNVAGVLLGTYLAYKSGILAISVVFVVTAGLLWYYSTTYKRQFLIGNIIVAVLTAMVPLMVVIFEIPLLNKIYFEFLEPGSDFMVIFYFVLGVAYFAFLTTLIREIIKDVEDLEGDNAYDRNTLPIVVGVKNTKIIILLLITLTIASVFYIFFVYLRDHYSFVYITVAVVLPLLFLALKLIKADSKKDYHFLSNFSKIIMLLGILYLPFYNLISIF